MTSDRRKHHSSEKGRIRRRLDAIFHVYRRRWFQVFATGLLLLALMEASYLGAANPTLVPAMILYGAVLVPLTLLVYLYERLTAWEVPMPTLAICFLCAGALGVAIASTLETVSMGPLGPFQDVGVGLIEESVKLVVPLFIFFAGVYRSEAAGVMVGFTSAMGFSSLETAGYGFNSFLGSGGNNTISNILKDPMRVLDLNETFLMRSQLDPVGHGVWTILTCYVPFHERQRLGRIALNWRVGGAFVLAVLLHAGWDTSLGASKIISTAVPVLVAAGIVFLIVLVTTFWLFGRIVRKIRQDMGVEPGAVPE